MGSETIRTGGDTHGIVVDTYQVLVFGNLVTTKQIDFVDSASGVLDYTDYLASGFGLIGMDFDTFPYLRVRGTRINGIQHGIITSVNERVGLPEMLTLNQNFPNPFNPFTTLSYGLHQAMMVELKVFDVLGREVTTLVNCYQQKGNHEVVFNARGLASGIYVYVLRTQTSSINKRMLLIR